MGIADFYLPVRKKFSGLFCFIVFGLVESGIVGRYYLYGDKGYTDTATIMAPYEGDLSPLKDAFNKAMSKVRIAVERNYHIVTDNWRFVAYKSSQKVFLFPVGKFYIAAVVLTNCLNCLRPNQTSQYFQVSPPSLEEYLSQFD